MLDSIKSKRLDVIKPSATLAVNSRALQLKAEGRDIINLGVGEPDFDTPDFIKQAAIEAMRAGKTKYTAVDGTPELKNAIARKFLRDNGLTYAPSQITVGNGGKQVIYNAFMATLNGGDEVIIPAPYWTSYPEIVLMAEGIPIIVHCPQSSRFKLTPTQLEAAITPKTKWLLLNSPSNPTGVAYTQEELKALGEVLIRHPHVNVMTDDIYEHIIYEGFEFQTIAQVVPQLYERTLTVNGVSKSYSMTGWRIGYAGGARNIIQAISVIQSQSTSNPCSIAQAAAMAALDGDQGFMAEWVAAFQTRRDAISAKLNGIAGVVCDVPEGAFYVFPSVQGLIGKVAPSGKVIANGADFATYVLEAADVAVVPGSAFGMPNHVRISYATSLDNLMKAAQQIESAVALLSS